MYSVNQIDSVFITNSYFVECESTDRAGAVYITEANRFTSLRSCAVKCHATVNGQVYWIYLNGAASEHHVNDNSFILSSYKKPSQHNVVRFSQGDVAYNRNNVSKCIISYGSGVYFAEETIASAMYNTVANNQCGGLFYVSTLSGRMTQSNIVNNTRNHGIKSYVYRQFVEGDFSFEECLFLDNTNYSSLCIYVIPGHTDFINCVFNSQPAPEEQSLTSTSSYNLRYSLHIKC